MTDQLTLKCCTMRCSMWTSCGTVCPSSTMILRVQWVNIWWPSSMRAGTAGVKMAMAWRTMARASIVWAFSRLWKTCVNIVLYLFIPSCGLLIYFFFKPQKQPPGGWYSFGRRTNTVLIQAVIFYNKKTTRLSCSQLGQYPSYPLFLKNLKK